MKHILLNNKNSVAYDDTDKDNIKVFIDGKEHEFEDDKNRLEYALLLNEISILRL